VKINKILTALIAAACIIFTSSAQISQSDDISANYGFGEMEIIKLDWGIAAMSIADLNNDGRNDIIVINNLRSRIEVLIQKEQIGPTETFVSVDPRDIDINVLEPPSRFEKQPIAVSQRMYSLVCGDLNSDSLIDLAYYGEPKGLYVLLQKDQDSQEKPDGKLSWHTRKRIAIDDGLQTPYALVCADLNGDGLADLALAARDAIYLVLQKKDGTLSEPIKYPSTATIRAIDAADINGDGINDLIMVVSDIEKPIHVRFGLPDGQLGPQVQLAAESPWAIDIHNIDGLPGKEILMVESVSGRLICYKLVNQTEQDGDWPVLYYPLVSGQGSSDRDMVIGDIDGDKLADVIISDPASAEIILYKQQAGTGLAEPAKFPSFADVVRLAGADIDNNGKTELAILSIREKVIGISRYEEGRFSFPKPIDIDGEPVAMDLADINGDGKIDCVYVAVDANQTRWLRAVDNSAMQTKEKSSSGLFGSKKRDTAWHILFGEGLKLERLRSNPDGIKVLDADQDGLADVLIFDRYNPPPLFARQIEKGKFELVDSAAAQSSLIRDASMSSIKLADIDQKSGDELLIAQTNFARSLVFSDKGVWIVIDQYNAKSRENNISAVAVFDFEMKNKQNNRSLLLLDGQRGKLQILKKDEDGTFRFDSEIDVGKWSNVRNLKMIQAAVTGDKTQSMVLFDGEKFAIVTPPGFGQIQVKLEPQFSYETKIKDGIYGHLTIGDINSGGTADIVMVEYKGNHIEVLALDKQYKPIPAMRFKIFEEKTYRESKSPSRSGVEPRELRIADVTADGKNDLVTIIHDRIIIYPQD